MDLVLNIPLHGSSLNIVKQCGPGLSEILDSRFGCVAIFQDVDFENDSSFGQQKRQIVVPEKRFSVVLRAGVEVSVWKADLTDFEVDAVVNAANTLLQHGGGLAHALCEAGGPQIQMESDSYTKKCGSLQTGDAIVTNSGDLPCKKVIHAVGPQLYHDPSPLEVSQAKPQLKKAICSILDKVKEHHLDTVAIPAISSGLFNYPLPECAETIVSTVKEYYDNSSSREHLPKEILFMNHDEPTVNEMEKACHQILAPHLSHQSVSYSQAEGSNTRADTKTSSLSHQSMSYSQAAGSNTRAATKTPSFSIQIGGVLLTLKADSIEEQKTDVIVNTTSLERDLNTGQVSKALLKKAGKGLQHEIRSAPRTEHVIITGSHNLLCKNVYHTFCINNGQEPADKFLFDSVLECLSIAAFKHHHKSIAFPAIGTGNLGFSKHEVAQIMSDAVVRFARSFSGEMDVYFVIFPSDYGTFQAFKEKMTPLQPSTSHFSSHRQAEYDDDDVRFNRAAVPQMSLRGTSKESLHEAEKWLENLVFSSPKTVYIYNNFIEHLSEKEYVQLSRLSRKGVEFEEFLSKGHACLIVSGKSVEDVVVAALQVEAMLCTVQNVFVTEENQDMCALLGKDVPLEPQRKTVDDSALEFRDRSSDLKRLGLRMLKLEKVENPALKMLFELKKQQLGCSSETMFQCIPAQFREMVSQIGFHAECAPPEDPKYGEGIYFARTVTKATEVWKQRHDQYLYFVEADVLTGKSTPGKPGLILPPAVQTDPLVRFDSVCGESDIFVIFSGYQALPRYIITCMKKT